MGMEEERAKGIFLIIRFLHLFYHFFYHLFFSYLILNKFKFSEYFIIRFIQKTVLFFITYIIIMCILIYFNLDY